jgi:hypothetical protein
MKMMNIGPELLQPTGGARRRDGSFGARTIAMKKVFVPHADSLKDLMSMCLRIVYDRIPPYALYASYSDNGTA